MRDSVILRWLYVIYSYVRYKFKYRKNAHFSGITYFYADGNSSIEFTGKNTWVNNYSVSNMFGLYQRTIFYAKEGGKISIGSDCGISGTSFCAMQEITIGDRVQIGANTKILDNDQHSIDPVERFKDIRDNVKRKPVIIGDDCFIGANVIILKGTVLGNKCVVGAGSVVHGEFPDGAVIAGNPAKIIKMLSFE